VCLTRIPLCLWPSQSPGSCSCTQTSRLGLEPARRRRRKTGGGEGGKQEEEDRRKVGVGQEEEDRKGVEEEDSVSEEWRRLGTKTVESMTEYLV
jgi:hypothetical protein